MLRPTRLLLLPFVGALTVAGLVSCGGDNPYDAARSADTAVVTTIADDGGTAGNDFLPEDQNVSDCIGTVERPNCGSTSKGGWRMTLVFIALIGGLAFIGWRIALQIRARDAVVNRVDD